MEEPNSKSTEEPDLNKNLPHANKYVERAVPTFIYSGTLLIVSNYLFIPLMLTLMGSEINRLPGLPVEFWASWGGILAAWIIGNSIEKLNKKHPTL